MLAVLLGLPGEICRAAEEKVMPYDAPDQVVWHKKSGTWFVSNLGGGISLARDGVGWITRLAADGRVTDARWLAGFDAPSGMVATDDTLYVCDRDGLVEVDIASAAVRKKHPLPDALFVNDVARAADGSLYVSDFFGNRIYRIPPGGVPEVFLEGEELNTPDGLFIEGRTLYVATWGKISNKATFATSRKGKILMIDLKTKAIRPYVKGVEEVGNMEGLTKAGGAFYATDWARGALLRITPGGFTAILTGLSHPTDPDYSPELGLLAFPQHGTNQVLFLKIGK